MVSIVMQMLNLVVAVTGAAARDGEPAIVLVFVNDTPKGETVVRVLEDDVLVRVADLEAWGLGTMAHRARRDGDYVSLRGLAPGLAFRFDQTLLALRLTAPPEVFGRTVVSLWPAAPPGVVYEPASTAFVNAGFSLVDVDRYAVAGELGLSLDRVRFFSALSYTSGGVPVRGLSHVTYDERATLRRWIVGDRFLIGGPLGGSAVVGGLSVSREFEIDPYLLRSPSVEVAGAALTPSTAEVFVNERLVQRIPLPPGPFELRNVPVPSGSGITRVVIRDIFGREEVVSTPYYFSASLLAPGLHEYSYTVGARRASFGVASGNYRDLNVLGRHRVGVTDSLTAGFRLEASPRLASGGPILNLRMPVGEAELAGAISGGSPAIGGAASVAYSYSGRWGGLGVLLQARSDRYVTLALDERDDRPRLAASGFVAVPLGDAARVTLRHEYIDFRDRGAEQRSTVSVNRRLTRQLNLFAEASHGPSSHFTVFAGLSYFFDGGVAANVSYGHGRDGSAAAIDVHKARPIGPGFGYRVSAATTGTHTRGGGVLEYQGRYGRYELGYHHADGTHTPLVSLAGAIVAIDGRVFLTPPAHSSFALIRVPGLEGVRAYVNNQEIGRTNARGEVFAPTLLPYYGNRIAIADDDVPLDYIVEEREQLVAPPPRGGSVVPFRVRRLRTVTGSVVVVGGGRSTVPTHGQLSVSAGDRHFESPLGRAGEFYLENVPAGRHLATVVHAGGVCAMTIAIPVSDAREVVLGTLACVAP